MSVCSRKAVSGRRFTTTSSPLQAFQALTAPEEGVQRARKADLEVGVALSVGRLPTSPLTEPPRDLEGFFEPRNWWTRLELSHMAVAI